MSANNRAQAAYHELKMALNEAGLLVVGEGTGSKAPLGLKYTSRDRKTVFAECCPEGVLSINVNVGGPDQFTRDLIQAHASLFRALYLGQPNPPWRAT